MNKRILAAIAAGVSLAVFVIVIIAAIFTVYCKRKEIILLQKHLEEKDAQLNQQNGQITELSSSKASLARKKIDLEKKFASLERELSNLNRKETNMNEQLKNLLDEKNALEDGFNASVKILQEKAVQQKGEAEQAIALRHLEYQTGKGELSTQIRFLEDNLEKTKRERCALEVRNFDVSAMLETEKAKLHYYRQALAHESEKMYKDAVEKYEEILAMDSYESIAHMRLASLYQYHIKDTEKAKYHLAVYNALQLPAESDRSQYTEDSFSRDTEQTPDSAYAQEDLSQESPGQAEEQDAAKEEEFKYRYNLALQYDSEQRYEESLREYHEALLLMPDDADVHYNLGILYNDHIKDLKKAILHYQRYLNLNPSAEDAEEVTAWIKQARVELEWQRKLR